jgi:hypothetical protein
LPLRSLAGFLLPLGLSLACGTAVLTHPGSSDGGPDASPDGSLDSGIDAGGDGGTGLDGGDAGSDGGFQPGLHADFPQIPNHGQGSIGSPQLVTVTFQSASTALHSFGDFVVGSQWLTTVGADYGVGLGSHLAAVTLDIAAPSHTTEGQVGQLLLDLIRDGGLPPPGLPDGGGNPMAIYMVGLPAGTSATFGGGPVCGSVGDGTSIGGFHWSASGNQLKFPFAVIPTCAGESAAEITEAASHEFIEAATDPFPNNGWILSDGTSPWSYLPGEVGDFCNLETTVEGTTTLQRIYSNSAATAGGSPCVPLPDSPYYGVTATPPATTIAAGSTVAIQLDAWSQQAVPPWHLGWSELGDFNAAPVLGMTSVQNGDQTTLSLTVPATASSGSHVLILVYSYLNPTAELSDFSTWPVLITVQ